jgi:glycosyltransferase involved in cell wall biosynthesis
MGLPPDLTMPPPARHRLLQVFNRYVHPGGEERSVDRIYRHLGTAHEMSRCFFDSKDWLGEHAPGKLTQVSRLFYNHDSAARLTTALREQRPQAVIFHNIYPVGSPALYHTALHERVPVIQFMHNFRPFSVGGTLYAGGGMLPEALRGDYRREIMRGAWQGSRLRSLIFALMLKKLHRSGWLDAVHAWVGISQFIAEKVIEAGVPADRVHTLRHSWDAMNTAPEISDQGYYLFLGRLVEPKGIRTMLDAWDALHAQLGEKTPPLQIAGEGELEPLVRERAARNPRIKFLGLIDGQAKHDALRHCRAVLVPSVWWEPLGLVVYEAYDFAKPVLAARSGGLTETVQPGVTGLLHDPGDSAALVIDVMQMEHHTADERHTWGQTAREWLLREASVQQWMHGFEQVLASLP